MSGRVRVNTPDGIYRAALDGLGVAYAPVWLFEKELKEGRLVPLLLGEAGPSVPINIVYPAKRLLARRASVFIEAIAEKFGGEPVLNEGAVKRLLRARRSARPRG